MIRFIIVDDDKKAVQHTKKLLKETVKEDIEIYTFDKFNLSLKKEIQNTDIHKIYILDIELNSKVSGIWIAKLIRDIDWESEIIFTTNHDKMYEIAHRTVYEVFDFLEKFHNFDNRLKKDITTILKRNFDNKMLIYKANNIELSIYYRSILYIYRETEDRKLVIVTTSNKYMINLNLKEILTLLDNRFVQCHRSCIINLQHIQEKNYKEGYFTLDTGKKVYMISKKFKKDLENV